MDARPCEVLHDDGSWYRGTVEQWWREDGAWWALVAYSAPLEARGGSFRGNYLRRVPEGRLRPAQEV